MAIIKKTENKCWQVCGEIRTFVHCCWEHTMVQDLWKTVWQLLATCSMELPYDPAILLLDTCPEAVKAGTREGICILCLQQYYLHRQKVKQPKYPLEDEWINKT